MIDNQPPFVAGKTKYYISEWLKMTTDPEILDYIYFTLSHRICYLLMSIVNIEILGQQHFNEQQQIIITTQVHKLLDLGVIERSEHEEGECMSPIFVVPKSDGTYMYRLIFNFKKCNKAVLFRHFKIDTLSTATCLITLDSYVASLDLKHAYYSIPIATEQRRYLKFVWNGQLYEFGALPVGLTSSPRIFTKVMKPP